MSGITSKAWFWVAYAVAAALALALAAQLFPRAIPIVNLDIRMSRGEALAKAEALAVARHVAPAHPRTAARFDHDGTAQNYIELEGGGKAAFTALTRGGLYAPYWWAVRVFEPGVIDEATLRFRPDGTLDGFSRRVAETYVHDPSRKALSAQDARALAEARARADWGIDVGTWTPVEQSQETQKTGRVDHAFVYERPERIGDARIRLRLVVAGDELIGAVPYVKVPESFLRRYAELRSTNNLIAGIAGIAALLLYGIGGVVIGALWLSRRNWLLWRPSLAMGALVGLLLALAALANAPGNWFGADTTDTVAAFWTRQAGLALAILVLSALGLGAVFMAAEGLSRRAFPHQPQLWRVLGSEAGSSRQVLGRALGGYLFVPLELALIAAFYYGTNRWLGWWQPSEVLTDPNVLGSAFPALGPIGMSLEAGMMEECAFRAIPLSLGALIGARLGHRRAGIVVALILQAVVFGSAHANYPGFPAYSRPVELFVPALVWGLIFLRFGLLPTMLLHGTFDLTLFAIPVFLVAAPGAQVQQALIVLAGLAPLLVVLWRIARAGGITQLPVGLYNGAWQAPPLPSTTIGGVASAQAVQRENRYARLFQRALPLLGALGLLAFALLAPWKADVPSPRIGRAEAITLAEKALAQRGVTLPPTWQRRAVVRNASDEADAWTAHKFVWREAGRAAYHRIVGTFLAPPVWEVRFAQFEGDVAERAEEWRVALGPQGQLRAMTHRLPEGRKGASLDEDAARRIAEAELRARFGVDPASLHAVGADQARRPARVDWTFQWSDPRVEVGKGGEARYVVSVAGDEPAAFGRYVFVPEAWVRAERERANRGQLAVVAAALVFVAAGLAALVVGVIAWTHRRCDTRALWLVFVVTLAAILGLALDSLPSLAFQLRTAEPVWSQWLMRGLGSVAGSLLGALLAGLLAGVGAFGARTAGRLPLAGRLPPWGAAIAGALLVLGVQSLLSGVGGSSAPVWPPLPQSQLSPLVGALLAGAGTVPWIGAALFVVYVVSRLTHGFTRRAWVGVALIVVLQAAGALAASNGQYVQGLAAGITGGLVAGAVLWWLIRYDVRIVPAYAVTGLVLQALVHAFQSAIPAAALWFVAHAAVAVLAAWLWTRYLGRPMPAPAPR
jgi:hypothetical protein